MLEYNMIIISLLSSILSFGREVMLTKTQSLKMITELRLMRNSGSTLRERKASLCPKCRVMSLFLRFTTILVFSHFTYKKSLREYRSLVRNPPLTKSRKQTLFFDIIMHLPWSIWSQYYSSTRPHKAWLNSSNKPAICIGLNITRLLMQ